MILDERGAPRGPKGLGRGAEYYLCAVASPPAPRSRRDREGRASVNVGIPVAQLRGFVAAQARASGGGGVDGGANACVGGGGDGRADA